MFGKLIIQTPQPTNEPKALDVFYLAIFMALVNLLATVYKFGLVNDFRVLYDFSQIIIACFNKIAELIKMPLKENETKNKAQVATENDAQEKFFEVRAVRKVKSVESIKEEVNLNESINTAEMKKKSASFNAPKCREEQERLFAATLRQRIDCMEQKSLQIYTNSLKDMLTNRKFASCMDFTFTDKNIKNAMLECKSVQDDLYDEISANNASSLTAPQQLTATAPQQLTATAPQQLTATAPQQLTATAVNSCQQEQQKATTATNSQKFKTSVQKPKVSKQQKSTTVKNQDNVLENPNAKSSSTKRNTAMNMCNTFSNKRSPAPPPSAATSQVTCAKTKEFMDGINVKKVDMSKSPAITEYPKPKLSIKKRMVEMPKTDYSDSE